MHPTELKKIPKHGLSVLLIEALSYRDREILKLISGVGDGHVYTPEEVAAIFKIHTTQVHESVKSSMSTIERILSSPRVSDNLDSNESMDGITVAVALPEFCDEEFVSQKLFDLYLALNDMHVGLGGSGLVVNDEESCTGAMALEGEPIQ